MTDILNGQVVAALSQWQGAALIVSSLALAYGLWFLRKRRGLSKA